MCEAIYPVALTILMSDGTTTVVNLPEKVRSFPPTTPRRGTLTPLTTRATKATPRAKPLPPLTKRQPASVVLQTSQLSADELAQALVQEIGRPKYRTPPLRRSTRLINKKKAK